jgi:hypothetical protein
MKSLLLRGAGEVRAGLQEQRVAAAQDDVADAAVEALPTAVNRDDGRVVEGAELGLADRSPDQWRAG